MPEKGGVYKGHGNIVLGNHPHQDFPALMSEAQGGWPCVMRSQEGNPSPFTVGRQSRIPTLDKLGNSNIFNKAEGK